MTDCHKWSPTDIRRLRDLIRTGTTTPTLTAALKRPRRSIERACRRLGGLAALRACGPAQVYSLAQVNRLFGASQDTERVRTWIRRGWLICAERPDCSPRGVRYVTSIALRQFLTVRDAWPSWEPCGIRDLDMRAEAEMLPAWRTLRHEHRAPAVPHGTRCLAVLGAVRHS